MDQKRENEIFSFAFDYIAIFKNLYFHRKQFSERIAFLLECRLIIIYTNNFSIIKILDYRNKWQSNYGDFINVQREYVESKILLILSVNTTFLANI